MRITTICNLPPPAGGAEVFARDLVEAQQDLDLEQSVITHASIHLNSPFVKNGFHYCSDVSRHRDLIEKGIQIIDRLDTIQSGPDADVNTERMIHAFEETRPDVVHCHMPTGALVLATRAAKRLNLPLVATFHGWGNLVRGYGSFTGAQWKPARIRSLIAQSAHSVVVSRPMLDYCLRHKLHNLSMIPGAIKTGYFTPGPFPPGRNIVYVGKLNRFKGLRECSAAFLRVHKQIDHTLHLVGRGITQPHFDETGFFLTTRQQILFRRLILEGRIKLVGEVTSDRMRSIYQDSSLMVLPSHTEGLPISILEALSCGVPVVASAVGSIPDVVHNGINGYIIKAGSILQLSERMLALAGEADETLRARCRASIRDYDIATIARRYRVLFDRAMNS